MLLPRLRHLWLNELLKVPVSIAAKCNIDKIQRMKLQDCEAGHMTRRAYFLVITCASKGLCPWQISLKCSFGQSLLSTEKAGNKNGAKSLDSLDCLDNSLGWNWRPSGRIRRNLRSRLGGSFDLDSLVKASNITSLKDKSFRDNASFSPRLEMKEVTLPTSQV